MQWKRFGERKRRKRQKAGEFETERQWKPFGERKRRKTQITEET